MLAGSRLTRGSGVFYSLDVEQGSLKALREGTNGGASEKDEDTGS